MFLSKTSIVHSMVSQINSFPSARLITVTVHGHYSNFHFLNARVPHLPHCSSLTSMIFFPLIIFILTPTTVCSMYKSQPQIFELGPSRWYICSSLFQDLDYFWLGTRNLVSLNSSKIQRCSFPVNYFFNTQNVSMLYDFLQNNASFKLVRLYSLSSKLFSIPCIFLK